MDTADPSTRQLSRRLSAPVHPAALRVASSVRHALPSAQRADVAADVATFGDPPMSHGAAPAAQLQHAETAASEPLVAAAGAATAERAGAAPVAAPAAVENGVAVGGTGNDTDHMASAEPQPIDDSATAQRNMTADDWALSDLMDAPTGLFNNVTKQAMVPLNLWCAPSRAPRLFLKAQCHQAGQGASQGAIEPLLRRRICARSCLAVAMQPRSCCWFGFNLQLQHIFRHGHLARRPADPRHLQARMRQLHSLSSARQHALRSRAILHTNLVSCAPKTPDEFAGTPTAAAHGRNSRSESSRGWSATGRCAWTRSCPPSTRSSARRRGTPASSPSTQRTKSSL